MACDLVVEGHCTSATLIKTLSSNWPNRPLFRLLIYGYYIYWYRSKLMANNRCRANHILTVLIVSPYMYRC